MSLALIDAAILVGGHGARLGGADKARLPVGPSGTALIVRTARLLEGRVRRAILVGRPEQRYPEVALPLVPDGWPDSGPLGGLATALGHFRSGWTLVLACDLPALSAPLIDGLLAVRPPPGGCVVPVTKRGLEPLCALYDATLHESAAQALARGERAVHRFVTSVAHTRWPVPSELESALHNVNTPDDLALTRA